ncbi:unnamed protein product [Lampetra fluviatilis]
MSWGFRCLGGHVAWIAWKSHGAGVAQRATASSRPTKRTPNGRGSRQQTWEGSGASKNKGVVKIANKASSSGGGWEEEEKSIKT